MRACARPSSTIPAVLAFGVSRNYAVENINDPEYVAAQAARVSALERDPRFARCRRCVDDAKAEAARLGIEDSNAPVHCETRCPLNPDHAAAVVWDEKRGKKRANDRLRKRANRIRQEVRP